MPDTAMSLPSMFSRFLAAITTVAVVAVLFRLFDGEEIPVTVAGRQDDLAAVATSPSAEVVIKTVTETKPVPFKKDRRVDLSLQAGTTLVVARGANGVKAVVYEVTLTDGVETARRLISQKVIRKPVTQVIAVGARPPLPW